jgi:predicted cupin superfamily sugar epimerase
MKTADYYIEKLSLSTHVEGGAFRETYRSEMTIAQEHLSSEFKGTRNVSTAIYFLLKQGQFSALHRIASDELWHFYEGNTLHIYEITLEGVLVTHVLGKDLEKGESFQCVVRAGSWFGSRCEVPGGFSLVACTVAPGFDFEDFVLADRQVLSEEFPQHQSLIRELTYS